MSTWETSFKARTDLLSHGDTAIGLFALQLKFSLDDIDSVAADSITEGNDDKKCDIIYLNKDDGVAVVCQCYTAKKTSAAAPANKASDLNTAVGWLLQRAIEDLPRRLQASARELRGAIDDGTIEELHIWYVHNLPESSNVKQELITVESTADSILKRDFPTKRVKVQALEVGKKNWRIGT